MAKHIERCGLASTDAAYRRLGVERGKMAVWEDGRRTGEGPSEFEWWYLDASLDDGSSMVIAFFTKDVKGGLLGKHIKPLATFELDLPSGEHIDERIELAAADFSAAKDRCDVRIGNCTFKGDLNTYEIVYQGKKVQATVKLTGTVSPWRPETGMTEYGDNNECFFAWFPSVPEGRLEADVRVGGKVMHFTGKGYHDHNWGNVAMMKLLNHWYWGRAKIGPYTVISSYLIAQKKYGYKEIPVFMLARDGTIIADDGLRCVDFAVEDRYDDPKTGQLVCGRILYTYRDGDVEYRIVYQREGDLLQQRMVDMLPDGVVKLGAKLIRFDGAYHRMRGTATLEKYVGGELVESYSDPAIWEFMFFGSTPRDRAC